MVLGGQVWVRKWDYCINDDDMGYCYMKPVTKGHTVKIATWMLKIKIEIVFSARI